MFTQKARLLWWIVVPLALLMSVPVAAQDARSDILNRINGLRSSLGLAPYTLNGALNAAAGNHASWMATSREVSHVQPNGSRPRDRARSAGYGSNWVSENIYMGTDATPNNAWNFWINSPVHYAGLTNTNYTDIGIGAASVDGWHAFVLVFGNPGGASAPRVSISRSAGGGSESASGPPEPPPFVVGVDPVGNIMHEVQPGDTWGDILLTYGYDWIDLERVLTLNGLRVVPEDIRTLQIGSVVLVPPWDGTYTPTPGGPPPEATAPAVERVSAQLDVSGDQAVPAAEDAPSAETPDGVALLPPPATFVLPSVTPSPTISPTPTVTPTLMIRMRTLVAPAPTAVPPVEVESNGAPPDDAPPLWLIAVVLVQVGVLGLAGFEFLRRGRR